MVQVEDELAVSGLPLALFFEVILAIRGKLRDLPRLTFVLAEILNDERVHIRNSQQPLASRVNCKSA